MFDEMHIDNLIKKAEEIQNYSKEVQDSMTSLEIEGESEGGVVKVLIDAKHIVKKVSINWPAINNRNKLESYFLEAVNDATHKLEECIVSKMINLSYSMRDSLAEIKMTV